MGRRPGSRSQPLKRRKDTPEHRYLPKVVIVPHGMSWIRPACTCGWEGTQNDATNAKHAWRRHARGPSPA